MSLLDSAAQTKLDGSQGSGDVQEKGGGADSKDVEQPAAGGQAGGMKLEKLVEANICDGDGAAQTEKLDGSQGSGDPQEKIGQTEKLDGSQGSGDPQEKIGGADSKDMEPAAGGILATKQQSRPRPAETREVDWCAESPMRQWARRTRAHAVKLLRAPGERPIRHSFHLLCIFACAVPVGATNPWWPHARNLQIFTTMQAYNETGYTFMRGEPSCDHIPGKCRINGTEHGLLFPWSMLDAAASLRCDASHRERSYFFRGNCSPKREPFLQAIRQLDSNANAISCSRRGRNDTLKWELDVDYLRELCCSHFALAPTGDCPWSYRFFEAIMCMAIPVLPDGDKDMFASKFHFLRAADAHVFNEGYARQNLAKLIRENMLPRRLQPAGDHG